MERLLHTVLLHYLLVLLFKAQIMRHDFQVSFDAQPKKVDVDVGNSFAAIHLFFAFAVLGTVTRRNGYT